MPDEHIQRTASTLCGERGLVSVVIPFLNAELFLNEAIASILAQTYERWELLLVNDGSTDRSAGIAERHAKDRPSQIRCLRHADLARHGISTSRNLGIANSTGEYIAFLDADDVWFPNKLERQVALLMAEQDAAMVFGSSLSWHSWTRKTKDLAKDTFAPVLEDEEPERFVDLPMLSVREVWHTAAPSGILVRRHAAAAVGNFESGFDNLYEDQAFYFKLGLNAKALASPECWYKYRQHPNSECAIGARTGAQAVAKMKFLRWAIRYLASSKIERPDLVEALSQELSASDPLRSRSLTLEAAEKWKRRLKQAQRSNARAIVKKVPGIWSTWQLGRALCDAWMDSSQRAQPVIKKDFDSADPWNYNSDRLEKIRHRREAEMLDRVRSSMRFPSALEIGCAEGTFTGILADRCESLLATDFSEVALERARLRCQHHQQVRFAQMDLRNDAIPGMFDLIVAVHVVEYIKNPFTLRRLRENLVRALRIGGHLLLGSCTGHDEFRERLWWSRHMLRGGNRINEFIASHPALTIVDAEINPLPGSISRDILLRRTK
jgi:glycosyltransferase involved in cell wall biosynthesis/SAM-dependent methyltransferase